MATFDDEELIPNNAPAGGAPAAAVPSAAQASSQEPPPTSAHPIYDVILQNVLGMQTTLAAKTAIAERLMVDWKRYSAQVCAGGVDTIAAATLADGLLLEQWHRERSTHIALEQLKDDEARNVVPPPSAQGHVDVSAILQRAGQNPLPTGAAPVPGHPDATPTPSQAKGGAVSQ